MKTYHVAHILVAQKYEAEDLLRKLKEGKDFAELARKYSSCPSASIGGDLGVLPLGKTVEDFEDASLALKPGEISTAPVRTKFGYHLIKRIS